MFLHGVQGIAASFTVIVKVAAEALSGAGRGRIRTLKVRVRVVRRSGQRGCESRCYWRHRARPIDARCDASRRFRVIIVLRGATASSSTSSSSCRCRYRGKR